MDKIASHQRTLAQLISDDHFYNIPRYQRLYVWGDEQIKTMFHDINTAASGRKAIYFLGAVLIVKSTSRADCYDLVDGQQRFTTLWLLANELKGALTSFTKKGDQLRLQFAIRQEVYAYFDQLEKGQPAKERPTAGEELYQVSKALKAIKSLISENLSTTADKSRFIDFLLNRLTLIVTEVPEHTNLNKLFETLNNRGVQLNQHEILKNKLLGQLPNKQERIRYGKIWNACSDMHNYVERNINVEAGSNLAGQVKHGVHYLEMDVVLKRLQDQGRKSDERFSLSAVLKDARPEDTSDVIHEFEHPESNEDEFQAIRSILTFPQLLLHVLRIHRYQRQLPDITRINEKELLSTFESSFEEDPLTEKTSKAFIRLLWGIRQTFDRYVIKWVKIEGDEQEEIHQIKALEVQNQYKKHTYYFRRIVKEHFHGLALLQSMLYHSQENITQYWLTPYLYRMYHAYPSHDEAFAVLKQLDNVLLTANEAMDKPLAEKTWEMMEEFPEVTYSLDILDSKRGTGFPHYWFYKLEFVLWHERSQLHRADRWKDYRLNSRNSVEHIGPQNPRDLRDKVCEAELDGFGNLVLVTRSINSEYGDHSYGMKRARFISKRDKGSFDSLKSDLIYAQETWDDEKVETHKDEMKQVLAEYIGKHQASKSTPYE